MLQPSVSTHVFHCNGHAWVVQEHHHHCQWESTDPTPNRRRRSYYYILPSVPLINPGNTTVAVRLFHHVRLHNPSAGFAPLLSVDTHNIASAVAYYSVEYLYPHTWCNSYLQPTSWHDSRRVAGNPPLQHNWVQLVITSKYARNTIFLMKL